MKKLWKYTSQLGLRGDEEGLEQLSIILCNQLNTIIMVIMLFIFIILRITAYTEHNLAIGIGSLRVILLFIVSLINLFFSGYGKHEVSKFSIIFIPPVVFLLFPTFIGFVEEESFIYYPYVIIAFSIIPQLLLIPKKDRIFYNFTMTFYFILVVIIDQLLILFTPEHFIIIDRIHEFYVFYKVSHIAIFIFINSSVFYLRKLNIEYDHKLNFKNVILDKQNEELKIAMEDLKQAQNHLIQSEKMAALGTLTAGVAHEINNPLNFISGGINILKDIINEKLLYGEEIDIKRVNENIMVIETGLSRAEKILESLMIFSYQGKSEKKLADIHEIIDSVLTFLNAKISKNIKIYKDFKLNQKIPLYIDKIHQVFVNIIDNALYALKQIPENEEKFISIRTDKEKNEYAVIEIINSGTKIPDNIIKNIFDPFFTTKEVGQGTGLGLSITYNLIKEHQGEIKVTNQPVGVSFKIKIPFETETKESTKTN